MLVYMEHFLHHLNQALYDTNQLFWKSLIRPWLVSVIFGFLFLAFTFLPLFLFKSDRFMYVWATFSIVLCSFCYISYLVYYNSRHQEPSEPEVIFENEENGFSIVKEPPEQIPLTLKESLIHGVWWTAGTFFILLFTVILFSFVGV